MKSSRERNVHHYDESELLDLARKAFLESFPNSTRIDCPDPTVREAMASGKQNLAEHWDVFDHICICSPCYAEFLAARKRVSRRARIWLVFGLAVFAVMSVVGYATLRIYGDARPLLSNADLRKGIPPLPSPPPEAVVRPATIAMLNFRHWSVTRGEGEVPSAFTPPTLRRGNLSLRIELPLFSPAGDYKVSLRTSTDKTLMDRVATAHVVGGRTILDPVRVDLASTEPGVYKLSLETAGLRTPLKFPIHLR